METLYLYRSKRKNFRPHKEGVAQESVAQKYPLIRARVSKELKARIVQRRRELNKGESELTRTLWEDYFKKLDKKEQAEDVKDFLERV